MPIAFNNVHRRTNIHLKKSVRHSNVYVVEEIRIFILVFS